ncbi:DUF6049 family protein [Actinacidiphila glaucinigra]|uniref:DUF6049 family protein n=1 Tax=Actinacidiphila glaucinigra TaxID=235986 RepID=UPI002E2F313B|nr:DUF6049 family protein [Actinacidiphila glaucinigra]
MTTRDGQRVGEAAQHPGGTPARSRLRRATALLVGATLFTGLVQARTAPAAYAETSSGRTVDVSVNSLSPTAPAKGDTLTVTGTVTNRSKHTVSGAHVGVEIAPQGPLDSRSAINDVSTSAPHTLADGGEITGHTVPVDDLPAGISRSFTLKVPVKDLGLGADGVYQLGVSLTGQTRDRGYDEYLGIERTFLPWYPDGDAKPTRYTFLWPLIDRPHLAVRSESDDQQSPIFLDDDLAGDLAPGGRLQQMVALGRDLPVTWVIDPDLLSTVDAMTRRYQVAGPGGDLDHTTAGTGTENAKRWLSSLKEAVVGKEVVALPFADPDIASIAHRGKSVPGTLNHLKTATELATTTVEVVLNGQVTPDTDVSWPVEGAVDRSIVAVATSAGADKVIASSDSLGEPGDLNYTPTSARPIGGGTTAVVADSGLSKAFRGDMTSAGSSTLAIQKYLAQTLMITLQAPDRQRSVVVAPQRMARASQAQAMAQAITEVAGSGWAETADFSAAAKATPDPKANRKVPGTGAYPKRLRKQELSTAAFRQIQATQGELDDFMALLSKPDRVRTPFGNALMRSMSTEWRGSSRRSAAYRTAISDYLSDLMSLVYLLPKTGTLTLSGRSGTIPVTVKNELGQTVKGLELRLTSSQGNSLNPGDAQPVTVEGGHTRSLKFEGTAARNGLNTITAQLYTADGAKFSTPITFQVDVTSITSSVMLVIAAGLLLLVLAGARMYHQRKRRAASGGGDDDADPSGDDADPSDDGETGEDEDDAGEGTMGDRDGVRDEQPGDLAPDTSPESTDPSGTGEKVDR